MQKIAYLRKLIRLLFRKCHQIPKGKTGITCNIKQYLSIICSIGLYIRDPHCIYQLVTGEQKRVMSSIQYENIVVAFLAEGFAYEWIPFGIDTETPSPYFRFIGVNYRPTHSECVRFCKENGMV
jgi:hypothetical protein